MIKMETIKYLLIFCFFTSCSTDQQINYFNSFAQDIEVNFKEIEVAEVLPFAIDLVVLDSTIITLDMKDNPFFNVFNVSNYSHIGGFINRGHGPNEEAVIFPFLNKADTNTFFYNAADHLSYLSFDKETNALEEVRRIQLPVELIGATQIFILGNNIYGYNGTMLNKHEYVGFNQESKKTFDFGSDFPKHNIKMDDKQKNVLYTKIVANKLDGSKFAALYDKFPMLRIYDNEGTLLHQSQFNNHQKEPLSYLREEIDLSDINETTINYLRIKVTDKYIYGLYAGKTQGELKIQDKQVDDFCKEIHVWNWDGEPLVRFLLNKEIMSFTVSANDEYIIGTSVNNDNKLFRLDIKKYLH
jgi:hypothetical protein